MITQSCLLGWVGRSMIPAAELLIEVFWSVVLPVTCGDMTSLRSYNILLPDKGPAIFYHELILHPGFQLVSYHIVERPLNVSGNAAPHLTRCRDLTELVRLVYTLGDQKLTF